MNELMDSRWYIWDREKDEIKLASSIEEWGQYMELGGNRRVALDHVDDAEISTVFLGIDHNFFAKDSPILFETMVFGGHLDGEQERYRTSQQARDGHKLMIEKVKDAERRGKPGVD